MTNIIRLDVDLLKDRKFFDFYFYPYVIAKNKNLKQKSLLLFFVIMSSDSQSKISVPYVLCANLKCQSGI